MIFGPVVAADMLAADVGADDGTTAGLLATTGALGCLDCAICTYGWLASLPALAVCMAGRGGGGISTALSEIARWLGPGWRRCSASPVSDAEAGRDQAVAGMAFDSFAQSRLGLRRRRG